MSIQIRTMFVVLLLLALGAGFLFLKHRGAFFQQGNPVVFEHQVITQDVQQQSSSQEEHGNFVDPLPTARSRVTKKPFGIYVTSASSPISPERFRGYHTGVDLEVTTDEQNVDVPVYVLCSGTLRMKKRANGYGGVAVQDCVIDGKKATVVYGHIRLTSITSQVGDMLSLDDALGFLGSGYSSDTDGERKHLHLAIHEGENIAIEGYVREKKQLDAWIDPERFLQQ